MHIVKAGNIKCECGNDELVFVRCLPPFADTFTILCRKCKARGSVRLGKFVCTTMEDGCEIRVYPS